MAVIVCSEKVKNALDLFGLRLLVYGISVCGDIIGSRDDLIVLKFHFKGLADVYIQIDTLKLLTFFQTLSNTLLCFDFGCIDIL